MTVARLAIAACLAFGCSMSAFDDQRQTAWSDSNGAVGVSAAEYGVAVAGVTTDDLGATIAVLGVDPLGMGVISYDQTGELTLSGTDLPGFGGVTLTTTPTFAAAPEPLPGANGLVAVGGLGALDEIRLYDVSTGTPRQVGSLSGADCSVPGQNLGNALEFGFTAAGVDNMVDLVALRGNELFIFPDVDLTSNSPECMHCTLPSTGPVAQDLALIDVAGLGIIVSMAGALIAFDALHVSEDNGVECFTARPPQISGLVSPGLESDFGARLVVGDGNDDGFFDVAASAPSANLVYIVPSLTSSGPAMLQALAAPNDSGAFGAGPMVFLDLDADGGDELVVGDPLASPRGVNNAGQATVFVYSMDQEYERRAVLFDSDPEANQHYGRAVAATEFVFGADDVDLLIVGAMDEVFTLFRPLSNSVDPRQ